MTNRSQAPKRGGRPRKFPGPSRVVTLTLPSATIDQLSDIHEDRAKAIVKAAQFATMGTQEDETRVDLIEVGPDIAMIAVPFCKYLQRIPDVSLVQIVPGRFLIVISSGSPLSAIEIGVEDQIESLGDGDLRDRTILTQVLERLRAARRANRASLASVVLVDTN